MSFCTLPLSYCTNVHPGLTVNEVISGLDKYTLPIRDQYGDALAVGLWLSDPVIRELTATNGMQQLAEELSSRNLICYSLNAFPFGDFHSQRVKENVYLPDWSEPSRLQYTINCARLLAGIMPDGVEGSLSTVPLGFKNFHLQQPDEFIDRCIGQLIHLARELDQLYDETGRLVRLAIEPEPCCLLETTPETIEFFDRLRTQADKLGAGEAVQLGIGLCYDVCHQAVEFENISESISQFQKADIRINKLHISCALHLDQPAENAAGRTALSRYVEQRYLHQTFCRMANGTIHHIVDLTTEFADSAPEPFASADAWRIHFHVPVDAESIGPLQTTRNELKECLKCVGKLEYAPHLEVETYTWEVLPNSDEQPDLVTGFARELTATRLLIEETERDLSRPEPLLII